MLLASEKRKGANTEESIDSSCHTMILKYEMQVDRIEREECRIFMMKTYLKKVLFPMQLDTQLS